MGRRFAVELIASKTQIPTIRTRLVDRSHLLTALDSALDPHIQLAVVSAPAGSGKTTLVAHWLTHRMAEGQLIGAWLTLDASDNQPLRFWSYIASSLMTALPTVGQSLRDIIGVTQTDAPTVDAMAACLLDSLPSTGKGRVVLVIDDYHLIKSQAIDIALDSIVDRLPASAFVVIVSRTNPELSLARRRARGQLVELRWPQLRFSSNEVSLFMAHSMGLHLPADIVGAVTEQTEGWAAGIQLAALSIRDRGDADTRAFVAKLADNDKYISEFLLQEVLLRQPVQVQSFLLKTSILQRMCAPLCAAMTQESEAVCREMLEYLEKGNLFLVPLDTQNTWYRYHHLFSQLLLTQLHMNHELGTPSGLERLYADSCAWYEGEGLYEESITLAMSQAPASFGYPQLRLAADLLDKYVLTLFFKCDTPTLHGWLEALGRDVLEDYPLLMAVLANTSAHMTSFRPQSLHHTEYWLSMATRSLAHASRRVDLTRGFIALSQAYLALWRKDDPSAVLKLAQDALASLPAIDGRTSEPSYMRLYSGLYCNIGISNMNLNKEREALDAFDRAKRIGEECGDFLNAFAAVKNTSAILRRRGLLPEAADVCRRALTTIGGGMNFSASTHIELAGIHLEWNELETAQSHIKQGMLFGRIAVGTYAALTADFTSARLSYARGEMTAVREHLDAAKRDNPNEYGIIDAVYMRFLLLADADGEANLDTLLEWASRRGFENVPDYEAPVLARLQIVRGQAKLAPEPLFHYLNSSLDAARAAGLVEAQMEHLILLAWAHYSRDNYTAAQKALIKALSLSAHGGYVRVYLDEGIPMQALLSSLLTLNRRSTDIHISDRLVAYISRLLSCFRHIQPAGNAGVLLLPRELDVLRLAADGLPNAAIAQRLFISVNTVKKHLTNINSKLGSTNRREAADLARALGLLT